MEPMPAAATLSSADAVLPLRERYRAEMNCQIVHDSIHTRRGWTLTYTLTIGADIAGFAGVAIGGPWTGRPTIFELYVTPAHRTRAFDLFEALLASSAASHMEVQSNDLLLAVMLHTYARDIATEKIVFRDHTVTTLPAGGVTLRQVTSPEETRACIEERAGGTDWIVELDGAAVAKGGILFHYNVPYGDIYMEVNEAYRRRGLGAYLVQELKRIAYELGSVPAARCSPDNIPSRKTLQKAGLIPYAHILNGTIVPRSA
jgi:GNAT superfamily N-acetyltransferase